MEQQPATPPMGRLLDDAAAVADAWRLAGRWTDALTLLRGLEPVAAALDDAAQARLAVQTVRVLLDQATFSGMGAPDDIDRILTCALTQAEAADSAALQGAVWDARGNALHVAFLATGRSAEPAEELPCFERGLGLRRAAGGRRGIAESLFHVGMVYGVVRQNDELALPYLEDAYRLAQEIGDQVIASYAIRHIAFARYNAGDLEAAQAGFAESLRLREAAGFVPGVAMALLACAHAAQDAGDQDSAHAQLERARAIFADLEIPRQVAWVETLIAQLDHAEGV